MVSPRNEQRLIQGDLVLEKAKIHNVFEELEPTQQELKFHQTEEDEDLPNDKKPSFREEHP